MVLHQNNSSNSKHCGTHKIAQKSSLVLNENSTLELKHWVVFGIYSQKNDQPNDEFCPNSKCVHIFTCIFNTKLFIWWAKIPRYNVHIWGERYRMMKVCSWANNNNWYHSKFTLRLYHKFHTSFRNFYLINWIWLV